jgi:hypothetical protein
MNPPAPIEAFFQRKNAVDDAGLASLFTDDATVVDGGEGKTMQGIEEIKDWIHKSIVRLNLHTDVRHCQRRDGEWVIDTVMSGDFKASPARFEYFIALTGKKISALRVEFRGSPGSAT